jgi:purine-nucleoside phosphorylase
VVRKTPERQSRVILFVAAEPRECEPWVGHWSSVHAAKLPVHWARAGIWKGRQVLAIANGAGPERARAAVVAAPLPTAVCNIGFCGALDASLRIGDIFVATEVRNGSRTYRAQCPRARAPSRAGALTSQPRIARTAAEKRRLRNSGAFAVEMEAAGAARASEQLNVPFYCIRAVSDLADEDFANDFNRCIMPDGRFNIARLLLGACASPITRFGELIRLSKRTKLASHNLGEFLADCDF